MAALSNRPPANRIVHYIKTPVPLMLSASDLARLSDFRVHYGHGRGYPWVIRLEIEGICRTISELHGTHARIGIDGWFNIPAPKQIESLYSPDGATVPSLGVRQTFSQRSPNGPFYARTEYGNWAVTD
jgi:hypothetical protein